MIARIFKLFGLMMTASYWMFPIGAVAMHSDFANLHFSDPDINITTYKTTTIPDID